MEYECRGPRSGYLMSIVQHVQTLVHSRQSFLSAFSSNNGTAHKNWYTHEGEWSSPSMSMKGCMLISRPLKCVALILWRADWLSMISLLSCNRDRRSWGNNRSLVRRRVSQVYGWRDTCSRRLRCCTKCELLLSRCSLSSLSLLLFTSPWCGCSVPRRKRKT